MRSVRSAKLSLAGLTLLALGLRLYRLDRYSIWYDEAIYFLQAKNAFHSELIGTLHGRIGTVVLWLWSQAGSSDLWLRLLPALLGTATVPVMFFLARRLADERTAFFTAAVLAVHPLHIYYSQTIRREALVLFVLVTAFHFFLRALAYGRVRDTVLYVLFGSLAVMMLVLCAASLFGLGVYALIRCRKSKPNLRRWLAAHGLLGLVIIVVVLGFLSMFGAKSQEPVAVTPSVLELAKMTRTLFFGHHLPMDLLFPAAVLPVLLCLYGLVRMARIDRPLLLFVGLTIVPAIAAFAAGALLGHQIFVIRYTVFLLPILCFLLAYGVRYLHWSGGAALGAGLALLLMGLSNVHLYQNRPIHELEVSQRADYRSMADFILKNKKQGDLVAHFHRASRQSVNWYTRGEIENMHFLFDTPECASSNEDNAKMANRFRTLGSVDLQARQTLSQPRYKRAWLVISQWQPDKPIYFRRQHLWRDTPCDAALNWMKRRYRLLPLEGDDETGAEETGDDDGLYFGGMPWVKLYLFDLTPRTGNGAEDVP